MNNSNFGLETIGNLSELLGNAEVSSGTPLRLPLASIKEDPDQPRKEFDEGKIQELANSILERGVKTPISVRQSSEEGVYVINHGARRYRASLLAGLSDIPAYIDQDYSLIDQAVENIQRDNLTSREIADVIGRLLAEGMKKGQIAEKMGKSPAFVTQHASLLDLPEPLANAFNSGKVSDLTVINDLNSLYKKEPEAVEDLLSNEDEITRSAVRNLKEFLNSDPKNSADADHEKPSKAKVKEKKPEDPDKLKKAIVQVMYQGQLARLVLNKRGLSGDEVWIKFEESGETESVPCKEISGIVAVIEG